MRQKQCKHKFRARYNEKWTTLIEELIGKGQVVQEATKAAMTPYLKEKTYIYDICIKCGQIIKRI